MFSFGRHGYPFVFACVWLVCSACVLHFFAERCVLVLARAKCIHSCRYIRMFPRSCSCDPVYLLLNCACVVFVDALLCFNRFAVKHCNTCASMS